MFALKPLDVSDVGDVTIVRCRDRKITEAFGIDEIGQELVHLVEGKDCRKLVVSLASVNSLPSATLGKLITLRRKAAACGCAIKLTNVNELISLIFSVTRLDGLFDIEEDEDHALKAFAVEPTKEHIPDPAT